MHTGAFAAAGQRLADTDDSFSSAPRGILIGQIAQILRRRDEPAGKTRSQMRKPLRSLIALELLLK